MSKVSNATEHSTMKAAVHYQAAFRGTPAALPDDVFKRLTALGGEVKQSDMNLAKKINSLDGNVTNTMNQASDELFNALNAQWAEQHGK